MKLNNNENFIMLQNVIYIKIYGKFIDAQRTGFSLCNN